MATERKHQGLRIALATSLSLTGAGGAVLAGKAILEGTSRQPVSTSEKQEGGIIPSQKAFDELVSQIPSPTISVATSTSTPEPTASATSSPTKEPSATPTEIPTQVPTKTPEPTKIPTPKPTPPPTAVPTAVPTSAPVEQPTPVPPTPKSEAPSAAFPKEIGNLERDNIAIHNKGVKFGMITRDFDYLSQMAKKYGVKVEYFQYDTHHANPFAQVAVIKSVHRNPNGWVIPYGKEASIRTTDNIVQIHVSFDENIQEIVAGQIFPNDQHAQYRREEIEGNASITFANTFRFKAPRPEWPKSFGPAPEDLLRLWKPSSNLQLAISQ